MRLNLKLILYRILHFLYFTMFFDTIIFKHNILSTYKIKKIEEKINHDTKAVEYYFKGYLINLGLEDLSEWIHFGLTSEDVNNLAYSLMLKEALPEVIKPAIVQLIDKLRIMTEKYSEIA